jgi:hypothetical protein
VVPYCEVQRSTYWSLVGSFFGESSMTNSTIRVGDMVQLIASGHKTSELEGSIGIVSYMYSGEEGCEVFLFDRKEECYCHLAYLKKLA